MAAHDPIRFPSRSLTCDDVIDGQGPVVAPRRAVWEHDRYGCQISEFSLARHDVITARQPMEVRRWWRRPAPCGHVGPPSRRVAAPFRVSLVSFFSCSSFPFAPSIVCRRPAVAVAAAAPAAEESRRRGARGAAPRRRTDSATTSRCLHRTIKSIPFASLKSAWYPVTMATSVEPKKN